MSCGSTRLGHALGRDAVYLNQLETRRNVGVYGDLYELSRANGRTRQLTREARVHDPDLSPDGTTLICVRIAPASAIS